mmetsp:Transcript_54085/g.93122  ORF Transcript_54085/g.93122 Transcript_54085/m.93122 type:complete len:237 (+) Transcript_54085:457-1167(+)
MRLKPRRGFLLGGPANLADHDDALGLRVVREALQAVDEVGAVERVAPDAHARGLPQPHVRGLLHRLVREGARATDDADLAGKVDVARHDPDLALPRLDDARAVGANQAGRRLLVQVPLHLHHVLLRDPLCDGHDQRDLGLDGVDDGVGAERRRDVDHRRVGLHRAHGLVDRVENRKAEMRCAPLLGRHAANHVCAIRDGLLAVKSTLLASESLANDFGVLINPNFRRAAHPRTESH